MNDISKKPYKVISVNNEYGIYYADTLREAFEYIHSHTEDEFYPDGCEPYRWILVLEDGQLMLS